MRYRASPAQLQQIVRLLEGAGLSTKRIGLEHKPALQVAAQWCVVDDGRPMKDYLAELTTVSADRFIEALKPLQPEGK